MLVATNRNVWELEIRLGRAPVNVILHLQVVLAHVLQQASYYSTPLVVIECLDAAELVSLIG